MDYELCENLSPNTNKALTSLPFLEVDLMGVGGADVASLSYHMGDEMEFLRSSGDHDHGCRPGARHDCPSERWNTTCLGPEDNCETIRTLLKKLCPGLPWWRSG